MQSVSVIAPVHNGAEYVEAFFKSYLQADKKNLKVDLLVIENGSTDATVNILKKNKIPFVSCDTTSVYTARNFGVNLTTGSFLFFVDSDCRIDSAFFISLREKLEKYDFILGYKEISPCKTLMDYFAMVDNKVKWKRSQLPINAGNMLVSRMAFNKVGGFPPGETTAGDSVIGQKLLNCGFNSLKDSTLIVYDKAKTFKERIGFEIRESQGFKVKTKYKNEKSASTSPFSNFLSSIRLYFEEIKGLHSRSIVFRIQLFALSMFWFLMGYVTIILRKMTILKSKPR